MGQVSLLKLGAQIHSMSTDLPNAGVIQMLPPVGGERGASILHGV